MGMCMTLHVHAQCYEFLDAHTSQPLCVPEHNAQRRQVMVSNYRLGLEQTRLVEQTMSAMIADMPAELERHDIRCDVHTLHCISLRCIALHCVRNITLHSHTIHRLAFRFITLHHFLAHNITAITPHCNTIQHITSRCDITMAYRAFANGSTHGRLKCCHNQPLKCPRL